jgi:nicotinamidase-related amidase
MKMLGMQKGGKYDGPVQGTNNFQNYYLQKYSKLIFGSDPRVSPLKIVDEIVVPPGSILWIIDMQNDFIDIPMKGLHGLPVILPDGTDLGAIGAFAVSEGLQMIDDLLTFIRENGSKFTKIIFTRDFHPPDHCSFTKDGKYEDGKFPPHCIYDTLGAAFTKKIADEFTIVDGQYTFMGFPADIIFKGHHQNTDSFTAQEWVDDSYSFQKRQLTGCCQTIDCSDKSVIGGRVHTGGKKLMNYGNSHLEKAFDIVVNEQNLATMFDERYETPVPSGAGEIFVVGLAGEFCVKDTAILLKQTYPQTKVNVIQNLTRYVFIPVSLSFQRYPLLNWQDSSPCQFGPMMQFGEWKDPNNRTMLNLENIFDKNPYKALSLYLFDYNPTEIAQTQRFDADKIDGMKIRLSGFSQASSRYVPTVSAINDELKEKWHFASDHRILLKDFNQFGVNLLLPESSLVSVKGPDEVVIPPEVVIHDDIPPPPV